MSISHRRAVNQTARGLTPTSLRALYISEFVENTDIIEYGRSLDLYGGSENGGKHQRKIYAQNIAMYPLGIIAAEIT